MEAAAGTLDYVLDTVPNEHDFNPYLKCLGVDGVCIISHGSSSERAIVNAIQVAREMVEAELLRFS